MRLVLLLLIVSVPLLEIGVLIKVGQSLGFWSTLAVVVGTFFAGLAVLMNQGLAAPLKMQEALLRGEPPVGPILDGAMVAFAGVLLMTPGLIADTLGLILLIPPARRLLTWFALRQMPMFSEFHVDLGPGPNPAPQEQRPHSSPPGAGPVIDGEFERLDERTLDPNRRRPNGRDGA